MLKLSYDLHIHSCLSPCSDEDMTPANIVNMAKLLGLDVIAVTDHNSCRNCPAVYNYAQKNNILVIPGMELCTMEEVHVLCFFEELENAMAFDKYVYERLIKIPNNEMVFGRQEIYNEYNSKVAEEPYLLINATEISFNSLDKLMDEFKGIYVPAHVDKNYFSLLSNLGFVPMEAKFKTVEFKNKNKTEKLCKTHKYFQSCQIIINSNAHSLGQIQEPVHFINTKEKSRKEIINALTS